MHLTALLDFLFLDLGSKKKQLPKLSAIGRTLFLQPAQSSRHAQSLDRHSCADTKAKVYRQTNLLMNLGRVTTLLLRVQS